MVDDVVFSKMVLDNLFLIGFGECLRVDILQSRVAQTALKIVPEDFALHRQGFGLRVILDQRSRGFKRVTRGSGDHCKDDEKKKN